LQLAFQKACIFRVFRKSFDCAAGPLKEAIISIGILGEKARRRRGAELEHAILDATWVELAAEGYSNLTYEGVAKRSGTSRPVLYRRWPTRTSLASAAIARQIKLNPIAVPDLGSLREELRLLLRSFADRASPNMIGLMFEMSQDMAAENTSFLDDPFQANPLDDLVRRAVRRGEIDRRVLTRRMLRVPLSLVLHEVALTAAVISDEAIAEIVDEIFLPLVTRGYDDAKKTQ
jgi:AcrR family transcriptional regulator